MTSYWIIGVGLSALALLGLGVLRAAPPRTKLYLCLVAMAIWCVPWHVLPAVWASTDSVVQYVRFDALQTLVSPIVAVDSSVRNLPLSWEIAVGIAAIFGLCLFAVRIVRQLKRQRDWLRSSEEIALDPEIWRELDIDTPDTRVRVVDGLDNALVSGYLRPTIWLGDAQHRSPRLASILRHELTHIRQRDNFVLFYVALLSDLFWWNPIVHLLARQSRRYVELSCDRECQRESGRYRDDLSSELLSQHYRHLNTSLVNPISRQRGFNTTRIRELAKEAVMKLHYKVTLVILSLVSAILVSNIAVGDAPKDEPKIVNHLIAISHTATGTRSIESEFIGEDVAEDILRAAKAADVSLDTYMENDHRRVIRIDGSDSDELIQVLAAFENTGVERVLSGRNRGDVGSHIFLDLSFQEDGASQYKVTLAPDPGHWMGVTIGDYLFRVRSDIRYTEDNPTVYFTSEIMEIGDGEYTLIAEPSLTTTFGQEATIRLGEPGITLKLLPRQPI